MNILVTGGTGFIGSNLVKRLVSLGHNVVATGSESENDLPPEVIVLHPTPMGIDWSRFDQIDILFHQGALNLTISKDEKEMEFGNAESSIKLFQKVISLGCKKIIYASSTAVYGNSTTPFSENNCTQPLTPYAKSKVILENAAEIMSDDNKGVQFIGLRYCNVYGPGERHKGKRASMIYQLAKQIWNRPPKLFAPGEQSRDWLYVDDAVSCNIHAMGANVDGVFNCGTGKSVTFNEIVRLLKEKLRRHWDIRYIQNPYVDIYQNCTLCDIQKAKEQLNFEAQIDIEEGIDLYYNATRFI